MRINPRRAIKNKIFWAHYIMNLICYQMQAQTLFCDIHSLLQFTLSEFYGFINKTRELLLVTMFLNNG